jgi:hypothetical protein
MMNPHVREPNEFNGGIHMIRSFLALSAILIGFSGSALAQGSAQPKEWTFLVYLNGFNNLDQFGALNINQMEKIGSTDRVNVVVQWASLETRTVKRLLVRKDNDPRKVTSPVIENLGRVDMGDYRTLIDFVRWANQKYPAQKVFIDVWNHGSGWHGKRDGNIFQPMDISYDDLSGNHMTTKQLALAMSESAKIIGHKVDLYGSDACLMAMVEVAHEMKDSVSVYAGSEEVEPGAGWPYDTFLARWNALPQASPQEVAKVLSREYVKSYEGSSNAVTFSAFDLAKIAPLTRTIREFVDSFKGLNATAVKQILKAAENAQDFTNSDYVDFIDFLNLVKNAGISALDNGILSRLAGTTGDFIIANDTYRFPKAHGMAMWIPTTRSDYAQHADLYSQLSFDQATRWGDVLKALVK